jgi:hypothetical protein
MGCAKRGQPGETSFGRFSVRFSPLRFAVLRQSQTRLALADSHYFCCPKKAPRQAASAFCSSAAGPVSEWARDLGEKARASGSDVVGNYETMDERWEESRRRHPRVLLAGDVQVESDAGVTIVGQIANISVGGLQVLSEETLEPNTEVTLRFKLDVGSPLECRGWVVHHQPGSRMNIEFSQLKDEDGQAIAAFVQRAKSYARRSTRLPKRLSIVLRWQDLEGKSHEEPAETLVLSRYGGLLTCRTKFKLRDEFLVWWPERQKGSYARVVFRRLGRLGELVEIGFEFTDAENFWEIRFLRDILFWPTRE